VIEYVLQRDHVEVFHPEWVIVEQPSKM
jgi:hypothetical protein